MKLALLFDSALIITSVALMPGISYPQSATNNNYVGAADTISDHKINIVNDNDTLSSNFTSVTYFKPFNLQNRSLSRDFSN